MELDLAAITAAAAAASAHGISTNPYPRGSLEALAHEMGLAPTREATVYVRETDGQVFGVLDVGWGEVQSVVPADLAAQGEGAVHSHLADAAEYLHELASRHLGASVAPLRPAAEFRG